MKMQELRYGVEVETIKRKRGDVAKAIQSVVGGLVKHLSGSSSLDPWTVKDEHQRVWRVVADHSLTNVTSDYRAEVVSPVLVYDDLATFQQVVRAIRKLGTTVDRKCGMHIHIDASAFDGKTLSNLAKIVYKQEDLILAALGVSEARMRRFTKPMDSEFISKIERSRPKTKEQMNRIWYGRRNENPGRNHDSRYYGVNFHSIWHHGTIEFRWFEATLNPGKVKAAIQFVLATAAKALNSRSASSKRRPFDPQSAKYDFRCFLLRLGLSGDEFKTARRHLLSAMPGDAAFKCGRPKPQKDDKAEMEDCHETS